MASNTPTPKARALGAALRDARESHGIGLRALASRLGRDPGLLSRWETGKKTPRDTDVAQILTSLGVNGARYDEVLGMARGTDGSPWLAISLPEQRRQLAALLEFERTASTITDASPLLIPGLLQTSDHVRAIMTAGGVPDDEVETRVAVRIGRRDVITRNNPARLIAMIGEAALRQTIGTAEIMVEQLRHLLEMGERPNVELRVVPLDSGWHPALEGPFVLIESDQVPAVVHLENRRSGLFLHEDADIDSYRRGANAVLKTALIPSDSSEFITKILNEMETTE